MHDVLIIGSGVSGTSAALRFADNGIVPVILDVGIEPPQEPEIKEKFYSYREKNDSFKLMIGEQFEGLNNLDRRKKVMPAKLVPPRMRFVTDSLKDLYPVKEINFSVIQSFAQGGLANAWGAGVYRYNDRDLRSFPIKKSDLLSYYERLSKELGISGENDDLVPYFGQDNLLQKPLRLSDNAQKLMNNYKKKKKKLNKKGVFIGRPRLAVLSQTFGERKPCDYSNLEFWQPNLSHLYTPSQTLKKLIKENKVVYKKGYLVRSWFRKGNAVIVQVEHIKDRKIEEFECKNLVLAAGAVNSARLALTSRKDSNTRLTLLDNAALLFPFFFPGRIGCRLETDAFGLTQLNFIYDSNEDEIPIQGSILEITSPARAEFFQSFMLASYDNLRLIRYMLPAIMVMQLFLPSSAEDAAAIRINENNELEIYGKNRNINKNLINKTIKILRILKAYTFPFLVVRAPNGHGIHYSGTLPMLESSNRLYTCSKFGELYGEPGVYVADASVFPYLPSKNCSFTVMANAMRVADRISLLLKGRT
ncbi:MAG: GMC family oxidoreductase [Candidatus Aminicenantes bacterium]|nr:GMC family oxidoreductase [Candidatus Aminicenantes bacterium]